MNMPDYGRSIVYGVIILGLLLAYGREEQEHGPCGALKIFRERGKSGASGGEWGDYRAEPTVQDGGADVKNPMCTARTNATVDVCSSWR
jgi:hypothetical protein